MTDHYQSDALLRQYLDFHYRSTEDDYLPHHQAPPELLDYPGRCAELVAEYATSRARVLDLGCAVGGSSFVLAETFENVLGIDFAPLFIDTATHLATQGTFRLSETVVTLSSDPRKCTPEFRVGDACSLAPDLGVFDAVLMANLLCRLPDPAACLHGLKAVTAPGSVIVITTPCSWDDTYTPRDKWLRPTLEGLQTHLDPWCDCQEVSDIAFLLKDHERRAQHTVAQASVWTVR